MRGSAIVLAGLLVLPCVAGPVTADSSSTGASFAGDRLLREGFEYYGIGVFDKAAEAWRQSAQEYAKADNTTKQSEALAALAQGYLALGHSSRAAQSLELALTLIQPRHDAAQTGRLTGALGQVHLQAGRWDEADQSLREALQTARSRNDHAQAAVLLNSIGKLRQAQEKDAEALQAYRDSGRLAQQAQLAEVEGMAWINMGRIEQRMGHPVESDQALDHARVLVKAWPPSHAKANALTAIALVDLAAAEKGAPDQPSREQAAVQSLADAIAVSQQIRDPLAASYAHGYLGQLYERRRQLDEALRQTRLAVAAAQRVHVPESLYRWQWQTARILRAQGDLGEAIKAYRRAAETLQSIRPELLVQASHEGLAFREAGGQLFFQMAGAILDQADALSDRNAVQASLAEARNAIELFKASELRDYFKDNCVDALMSRTTTIEKVSQRAAVLYPIILPDRTELLLSFPDEIQRYTVRQKADVLVGEIRAFRRLIEKRSTRQYMPHAQRLYDWLIRPLEPSLNARSIETLVVVPDGALRTVPFSALHDGRQFLIARYAMATTPGLNLTDPHPLKRERLRVFSAGLTEGVQGFSPLPNVRQELQALEALYETHPLINEEFRVKNIETSMQQGDYSIMHVATHGQFARQVEDTFLLTFDEKLTMDRLSKLIGVFRYRDEPLELLTLSACETAAGDDRSALGLAGVAIKAGARSALATLWFINDRASSMLVEEFYKELRQPSTSKAAALQRAQLKLLENPAYEHPAYWAPFLLLNNWL